MDKAKAAVHDLLGKAGHHDTTVHETVAPAVVQETVHRKEHERVQPVVDREVHQDHYHTSVQPVLDREVLPEKHSHHVAAVEHREHHHGNEHDISRRLEQEAAQFRNVTTQGGVEESRSTVPTVVGEHKHHHVHETIQPVVQKETIQPHVIHTTVPVHEVHHHAPEHHTSSALPAVSMADYKKQGGVLSGREERYDAFEGEPRPIGSTRGNATGAGVGVGTGTGITGTDRHGEGLTGHHQSSNTTGGLLDKNTRHTDQHIGSTGTGHHATLREKLDPRIDSDGDGKAGIGK